MKNSKIILWAVVNSLAVFAYVSAVAWVMSNGERLFGKMDNFWGPTAMLLLFVLSALITGLLVLGRPAYIFLNGFKREGMTMLFYTAGFLFVIMVAVLCLNIAI